MSVTLDGQILFDEQQLEIEQDSLNRDSIERAVAGLDGVLSVDMGGRARKIRQRGTLRAQSRTQMNDRINVISAYMDGNTHTLVINEGEKFDNLRMDSFKVNKKRAGGGSMVVEYEIVYTQVV